MYNVIYSFEMEQLYIDHYYNIEDTFTHSILVIHFFSHTKVVGDLNFQKTAVLKQTKSLGVSLSAALLINIIHVFSCFKCMENQWRIQDLKKGAKYGILGVCPQYVFAKFTPIIMIMETFLSFGSFSSLK